MNKSSFGKTFKRNKEYVLERVFIMYHGTTMQVAQMIKHAGFHPSSDGMLGRGVYVSRSFRKASRYPKGANGQERAVLTLSVRVGKVKRINRQGHPLQKSWHEAGFDTAWVPPNCGMVNSGLEESCIWDPRRIKVISIERNTYEDDDDDDDSDSDGDGDGDGDDDSDDDSDDDE
ncbi:uncharacterized protein LOC134465963 [Engraulis encrasicolus]|uniref:uncharacterized protein LOC134465963 n=1 Tax=Engraulis encrasicolus TaxID=184585 RepID=UPI002FD2E242